jgi:hypothetical protein
MIDRTGLLRATLVGLLAARCPAAATPLKSEFQHAMRVDGAGNTGYCKMWCVAWDSSSHPDNHGCQAAGEGGVPIPPPKNPKKDKHGVHRKYCKKMCTADICGAASEDESSGGELTGENENIGSDGGDDTQATSSNEAHCALACTIDPPTNLKAMGALRKAIHTAKFNKKSQLSEDADRTASETSAAASEAENSEAAARETLSSAESHQQLATDAALTAKDTAKDAAKDATRLEEEAAMLKKMQHDALSKVDELANQGFFSRAKKIISHSWNTKTFSINADLDEELETAQVADGISDAANSRKAEAERAREDAGSATSESIHAQRRAIAAAANARAAKLSAVEAQNIMKGAKQDDSEAQTAAKQALGEMSSAKSTLLRGMFKNAVSRVAQKVSIDKKVADCTQKCTAILDAIEGAEPYTMNVLRAVSLGFD